MELVKEIFREYDIRGIYQEDYKDVARNLTDELKYEDITSGGTTLKEIQKAHRNPAKYGKKFIKKQVNKEIKITSKKSFWPIPVAWIQLPLSPG